MRILGIIPARGGSKGVPGKNKKDLGGKPLIQYTIEAALGTNQLTDLVVSTDDQQIATISERLGVEVPGLRPAHLSTDKSPSIDTVIYLLDLLQKKGRQYDAICLLQPTSPLRTSKDIDDAIDKFVELNSDSLISVISVPHEYNPHWVFEPHGEQQFLRIATGEKDIVKRRQDLPQAYIRNGAIYLTKCKIVTEKKSLYGETIGYHEMSIEAHINIDNMEDWGTAERLVGKVM